MTFSSIRPEGPLASVGVINVEKQGLKMQSQRRLDKTFPKRNGYTLGQYKSLY
jgi:hypothetical protein